MKNLWMPWAMFLMDKAGEANGGGGGSGNSGGDSGKDGEGKKDGEGGEGGDGNGSKDDDQGGEEDEGKVDLSKQPKAVQKLIQKLRTENAGLRTKNKDSSTKQAAIKKLLVEAGLAEDDSVEPEEQVKTLTAQTTALGVRNAILEACVEHGVGKDHKKFFEFLVTQELEALGEDDELTDERIAELAEEAKGMKAAGSGARSTSVTKKKDEKGKGNEGNPPPEGGGDTEVTLDKFVRMNVLEKSDLYRKKPELYDRLKKEAQSKGKFI